jgi:hypothetical protein
MGSDLNSPLSGRVTSRFGGAGKYKSKLVIGVVVIALVPSLLSTFAASVTVGTGSLEFGQGSQQAIACDDMVYIALGEEWHPAPTPADSSAGFFRIRTATVSNLNLEACAGRKLRLRLIDGTSAELVLGSTPDSKVLQIAVPKQVPVSNVSDPTALGLTYLTSDGQPIASTLAANVAVGISGTSVYDGTPLSTTSADVMFYLDPSSTVINIDGALVRRATVETVNNPS